MKHLAVVMLFVLGGLLPALPAPAAPSPMEQVRRTVDDVLVVLRDKTLAGQPRREVLSRLIRARFDFAAMAQRTLGKYWKEASPQEQTRFVTLFADLLEASYIGRIEAYSNETVSYRGERIEGDLAEVDTSIRSGNVDIPINYRMVHARGEWFVYDVIIEEVSLIKNYRSSYGEIVRREGYAGLFTRMEERLRELRTAPARQERS